MNTVKGMLWYATSHESFLKLRQGEQKKRVKFSIHAIMISYFQFIARITYYYMDMSVLLENITRKIHIKLNPGPKWHIVHILTSEEIIYDFHGYFFKQVVNIQKDN